MQTFFQNEAAYSFENFMFMPTIKQVT